MCRKGADVLKKLTNDHRTRITKMLIRKALTDLMAYKPVTDISVKELCEKAGINRGTFYSHYTDIYDLLEKIEEEMVGELINALKPLVEGGNAAITPFMISPDVFRVIKEFSDITSAILGPCGDKTFPEKLINIGHDICIDAYIKHFSGATRKQIEFYYAFVSAGVISILQGWMKSGWRESPEEIAGAVNGIMANGIGYLGKPSE